ncbi:DUF302 domain-containing protein [Poseidonocella sp. HB161398]|uniref:DUF302 domain-containing protein n=1 Tax=Poseidonocella sp. HB161398 TaxID=2320855 RepID=UPI00110951BC|nr:DUF302 domain-containing protein [Poseidonocella sp. HB161398]
MRPARLLIAPLALCLALAAALPATAAIDRPGWASLDTSKSYPELVAAVKKAATAEGMSVVTEAGPTEAAKARGIEIPGNRVIGIFSNDYAVRILRLSTAAMIEAPLRMYVTANPDGTATLSWKLPSTVFAPYEDEGGAPLAAAAEELDAIFEAIGREAAAP